MRCLGEGGERIVNKYRTVNEEVLSGNTVLCSLRTRDGDKP
jgi:hypothetical protein